MFGFRISQLAYQDIFNILDYTIEQWGMEQAERYKSALETGRLQIQEDPYRVNSKARDDLTIGCRSYRVQHHYFFYRINQDAQVIEIARILHERMHFEDHLQPEYFPNS